MEKIAVAIVSDADGKARKLFARHTGVFSIVKKNPAIVAAFGGDGTLMRAEHMFPGIPKLYLKNSRVGKLAGKATNEDAVAAVARGAYVVAEHFKLAVSGKKKMLLGLNDIVIHNADPRHAIRYRVYIDGVAMGGEIIGDGVVCATPLGSTGYYRSITDSFFEVGIGLAFNNSTEQSDHVIVREDRAIRIEISRGPAVCYADNQAAHIDLKEGDAVEIRKSKEIARIITIQ